MLKYISKQKKSTLTSLGIQMPSTIRWSMLYLSTVFPLLSLDLMEERGF